MKTKQPAKKKLEPATPKKRSASAKKESEPPTPPMVPPPTADEDKAERQKAIKERARDVVVIAGAGSGKTTLLAKRFAELVAPEDDTATPLDAVRIAAVTFTRRAAGELRNRIKGELLELQATTTSPTRKSRVNNAIAALDQVFAGTIHSFADRYLSACPIEAGLPPNYTVTEDADTIIHTVLNALENATDAASLAVHFSGAATTPSKQQLSAVVEWMRQARAHGIDRDKYEVEGRTVQNGWCDLFSSWMKNHDRSPPIYTSTTLDEKQLDENIANLIQQVSEACKNVTGSSTGSRLLQSTIHPLKLALAATDTTEKAEHLCQALLRLPSLEKEHFAENGGSAAILLALYDGIRKGDYFKTTLGMMGDYILKQSIAIHPTIVALYKETKRKQGVIDMTDLLVRLRDALKLSQATRRRISERFDHIFVDEFQDTDPVQVDVLDLLSTDRKGFLTIIGDPKQSIYRFRRADISGFGNFVEKLRKRGALDARLSVNFRSRPELIDQLNTTFHEYMGVHSKEFNPTTGAVSYAPLTPSTNIPPAKSPTLHVLSLTSEDGSRLIAKHARPIESRLLARHIAWLLSPACKLMVRDRYTASLRKIEPGDIAILGNTIKRVTELIAALREFAIPVFRSGGTSFTQSSTIQQYINALCAVADFRDGPAQHAIHGIPFGALTPAHLAATATSPEGTTAACFADWLADMRRKRMTQPVSQTAREIFENSLALRWFGIQTGSDEDIAAMQRFATIFTNTAAENGWDFDETARWARSWFEAPPNMSSPLYEGNDAVNILSIHQAKGLEFPVVALFDGLASPNNQSTEVFLCSETGNDWALKVGKYDAVHETGTGAAGNLDLRAIEKAHKENELKRLFYVAATRARDLLIVPVPFPTHESRFYTKVFGMWHGAAGVKTISPTSDDDTLPELAPFPKAAAKTINEKNITPRTHGALGVTLNSLEWKAVSTASHEAEAPDSLSENGRGRVRKRTPIERKVHADLFGTIVHRAMALHLGGTLEIERAVAHAIAESEDELTLTEKDMAALTQRVTEFANGMLQNLRKEGLHDSGVTHECEVPFTWLRTANGHNEVLRGCIDLICRKADSTTIVDFKTDLETASPETLRAYQTQIQTYADALRSLESWKSANVRAVLVGPE